MEKIKKYYINTLEEIKRKTESYLDFNWKITIILF